MKPTTSGLYLLLLFAVVFCAVHPYHSGMRLQMPQPAASVHHR